MTPQAQSTDIFEQHESAVRSYCRSFPAVFERASGHHLWDTEGRRYVDLLCGAGALNYGHNPAGIVRAVTDYLLDGQSALLRDVSGRHYPTGASRSDHLEMVRLR